MASNSNSSLQKKSSSSPSRDGNRPPSRHDLGRSLSPEARDELIRRVKREQRAQWLDGANYELPEASNGSSLSNVANPLLPAADIQDPAQAGSSIERPRSALHSGDFRQQENLPHGSRAQQQPSPYNFSNVQHNWLSKDPSTPWLNTSIAPQASYEEDVYPGSFRDSTPASNRLRAASYTAHSSFAFQPPTSPLANEARNPDLDSLDTPSRSREVDKSHRRRTFSPPSSLHPLSSSFLLGSPSAWTGRRIPSLGREATYPRQAHQPRRSLNSTDPTFFSTPQTPSARSRRPSQASESSPLQRLPMVGGYEESILRGRMSSHPSRPLDFVAQIGVLGKGKCKPSLKCPPHVSVPFPAVFYNYSKRPGSPNSEEGPSPYVGMIDLENHMKQSPDRLGSPLCLKSDGPLSDLESSKQVGVNDDSFARQRDANKTKLRQRRQRSPTNAPKGSYRIPQQGQMQIIIKNPNKTAVKLYLVPYDLTGMEAGQWTFIRQRCYSAGPVLDMPIDARKNLGTNRPEAALSNSENPKDRPTLRYLVHLNICCPSRGRFYLYKSIRVVFANRVPDGKEKLRSEIQLPEPRFNTWRPEKDQRSTSTSLINTPDMKPACPSPFGISSEWRTETLSPYASPTRAYTLGQGGAREREMMRDSTSPPSPHYQSLKFSRIRPTYTDADTAQYTHPPNGRKFDRLSHEEYARWEGNRSRTQSPRPGNGLLAMQLRDRSEMEKGQGSVEFR